MILKSVSYHDAQFHFDDLALRNINLIVGRNAIGKTRVINALHTIGQVILGRMDLKEAMNFTLVYESVEGSKLSYYCQYKNAVLSESMQLNEQNLLARNESSTLIYNDLTHAEEEIYPPSDKMVLSAMRDRKKYPWMERVQNFAQSSYGLRFGNISPQMGATEAGIIHAHEKVAHMYKHLSEEGQAKVIQEMQELQFALEDIQYNEHTDSLVIVDKRFNRSISIPMIKLSQGMHRSLSALVMLQYLIEQKKLDFLLVDDLGEGLDYQRASLLGKKLIKTCTDHHIQLICTSNDYFLMDVFALEELTVLADYTEHGLKIINHSRYPELYARFMTCGLSNFDFFSSDYIRRNVE